MSYKIKHNKKVINKYKFKRVSEDVQTMVCNVYFTRGGDCFTGTGLYLNKKVYIATDTGYYSYSVKDVGMNADNLCFQLLYLANPF